MTTDSQDQNQALDTNSPEAPVKKINLTVLKSYERCQQKYMEVYGRLLVRKNLKRRLKLQARLVELQERLKKLEQNLYTVESNNEP